MTVEPDLVARERNTIKQYADWYAQRGYQVAVDPSPRDLPEFLRTLAPDLIASRNGENIVVEIKTSSPGSFEQVQRLARALQHRAGWELQVVYADLADPEWDPPPLLPDIAELLARLVGIDKSDKDSDRRGVQFLLLWSIIEAAARHRLLSADIPSTSRISSSALIKTLLTEGIIEDADYALLRRGLTVRNAVAHGFLNQPIDDALFDSLRQVAASLLRPQIPSRPRSPPSAV